MPERRALPRFLGDPFVRAAFLDPVGVDALRPGLFAWRINVAFDIHNGLGPLTLRLAGLTSGPSDRCLRFVVTVTRVHLHDHARLATRVAASALHGRDFHPWVTFQSFRCYLLPL